MSQNNSIFHGIEQYRDAISSKSAQKWRRTAKEFHHPGRTRGAAPRMPPAATA